MKEIPKGSNLVVGQNWEEIELGWGTRPDGFSLHVSIESLKKLVALCRKNREQYPQEFTVPDGHSYPVEVDDTTYQEIAKKGYVWYSREYRYTEGNNSSWRQMTPPEKVEEGKD